MLWYACCIENKSDGHICIHNHILPLKKGYLPSSFDKELKKLKERNNPKIETPNSQSLGLFQMDTNMNLGSHLPQ